MKKRLVRYAIFLGAVFLVFVSLRTFALRFILAPALPVSSAIRSVGLFFRDVLSFNKIRAEYYKLKETALEEAYYKNRAQVLEKENERLRAFIGMQPLSKYKKTIGRIALDFAREESALFINVGEEQGIRVGSAVVSPANVVVGRVIEVGKGYSKVATVSDSLFVIAGYDQDTNEEGLVVGEDGKVLFRFLRPQALINIGDIITTSSLSTVLPAGMLIGDVVEKGCFANETECYAEVQPCFHRDELYEVIVYTPIEDR